MNTSAPLRLAVRLHDLDAVVRPVPFVALPREEIDRLHGSIEVVTVDEAAPDDEGALIVLHSDVALHHNYSWLTFPRDDGRRTLLLSAALQTDGAVPLFLGDEMVGPARRQVEALVGVNGPGEVRLAGLLREKVRATAPWRLGLLSVARLTARVVIEGVESLGPLELRHARDQFEARSQVVIDHLEAL